jgi:hypothetical protein
MTTTMTMKAITSVLFLISLLVSLQANLFRASKHATALPQASLASCKLNNLDAGARLSA